MAFQQYLAEEVAIDHADGVLSRREALWRLALLGLGCRRRRRGWPPAATRRSPSTCCRPRAGPRPSATRPRSATPRRERLVADLRAGLDELERRAPGARLGAVGFCAAAAALARAGLTHELVTYPGADHAFFNDAGPRYDEAAATQAYARLLDWFGRHLS
jgi:dienelactone hydrolase